MSAAALRSGMAAIVQRLRAAASASAAPLGQPVGAGDGQTYVVDPRVGASAWAALQAQAQTAAGELEDLIAKLSFAAEAWRPATTPPPAGAAGPEHPVVVLGVVDDARFRINGDEPFTDFVAYWPAKGIWTATHCMRSDGPEGAGTADDYPVQVRCWQPPVDIPPPWSDLWN